jgi:hypothetical protein
MGPVPTDQPLSLPAPTGPPPPGSRTVTTDDGIPLHVEVDGDLKAPLTVVFSHGFTARLVEWDLQRAAVRDRARVVLWDQRGHGRSGWTKLTKATIDRTGRDLGEVLDATTPTGPVVLAGHSMGGMSILALARQRPELFGDRIVGVFLPATSAGGLVVIAATHDQLTPAAHGRDMAERIGDTAELAVVPGAGPQRQPDQDRRRRRGAGPTARPGRGAAAHCWLSQGLADVAG